VSEDPSSATELDVVECSDERHGGDDDVQDFMFGKASTAVECSAVMVWM
jgi:hypothetical protein